MKNRAAESQITTEGVQVQVTSRYLGDHVPDRHDEHLFGYKVTITNQRDDDLQLIRRAWKIIDASGRQESVTGAGVVGQQPLIAAGESFTYGSFCPLPTAWGTMEGSYLMRRCDDGERFSVRIQRFHLFIPIELGSVALEA